MTRRKLQRQRHAEHLHRLGPVAVLHAMLEFGAGTDLDDVLARYSKLTPEMVRTAGADHFPAPPMRVARAA